MTALQSGKSVQWATQAVATALVSRNTQFSGHLATSARNDKQKSSPWLALQRQHGLKGPRQLH